MRAHRLITTCALAIVGVTGWACNSDSVTGGSRGTVVVRLTDAPFPTDSVDSVNVFVVRVDARMTSADSAAADSAEANASAGGWITLASPGRVYNLMALRNGIFAALDTTEVTAGNYSAVRLVIDPSRSRVVLKNGTVLSSNTSPSVSFPSGSTSGIKVNLAGGLNVVAGDTTSLLLDFDLDQSFVLRGNSITQLGLLFKPVIIATVTIN